MENDLELRKKIAELEEMVKSRDVSLKETLKKLEEANIESDQVKAELRQCQEGMEERIKDRTAELRDSEERFRALFDGIPVGIYRSTPGGQLVDVNPAFMEMLGYPNREEMLAINSANIYVDPEDRKKWKSLMELEGVVRDFEVRNRRYDGTVIWVNDTARVVKNEKGQILYYEGSLEDITRRKEVEAELRDYQDHLEELIEERTAELRKSEERYRDLFDSVPVGLYRVTPAGQILDVNSAAEQMLGISSREEPLTAINTFNFYFDPEDRTRWIKLMETQGLVHDFEYRVRRQDGTVFWVNDIARVVKDEQGDVVCYDGSIEDITKRKMVEEELRHQKEYFEALFVNNPVAALTADLNGDVISWNPMAEKLFGYTSEEAIGEQVDDLVSRHPSIREEALGYTKQVFSEGVIHAVTKRTHKNGTLVDVELLSVPAIVAGKIAGYIAIYHDISELQLARRNAEAANQAKSIFLANMSHELRTPLNAILGFAQLMENDSNLTSTQQENLGIINRSGEHLLALINDVLEMSKIEAGRVTLQEKSFDLYHLLDTLHEMFQLRASGKGLGLTFERMENIPRYVQTDEGKLRQILMNLLSNAIKFTDVGGVLMRTMWDKNHQVLVIEVDDSGPGIDPEELEAVFEPFIQTAPGQHSQEGTGLGLSISRQFARLMGGDITVNSELGKGSVFRFEIPVRIVDEDDVELEYLSRKVLGLEPGQPTYRMLVVDDRDTTRQLMVKLLEPLGFEIDEASNGKEAVEIWERWEPHLIWMDMRMPVMDGYEATRVIKARDKGKSTVIIALTASAFEEDRETILSTGCDEMLRKPFRKNEIFDVMAKHLDIRFIYEDEMIPAKMTQAAGASEVLTPEAMTTLPADWLDLLYQATLTANLELILNLADQIYAQNAPLAEALTDLANNFEYKKILNLLEKG